MARRPNRGLKFLEELMWAGALFVGMFAVVLTGLYFLQQFVR